MTCWRMNRWCGISPGKRAAHAILLAPFALMLWLSMGLQTQALAQEQLRIGVLAYRPAAETLARWQPTADHLNAQIEGVTFEIKPLGYHELEQALAARDLDLVLTNPSHYIALLQQHQAERIATLIMSEGGIPVTAFGGVIAVRAQPSAPDSLLALKGKRIASPQKGSLGGYQVQAMELVRAGLNPERDVEMVFTDMPHDRALLTLLEGGADAAFIRTGLIESMTAEGLLDPLQVRILNRQTVPSFPFLLSTRLYPEWPMAALPHLDRGLTRRIAIALMSLEADHPAASAGGYLGWAVPADYEPVRTLLETLGLPPYDAAPPTWQKNDTSASRGTLPVGLLVTLGITLTALVVLSLLSLIQRRRQDHALAEARVHSERLDARLSMVMTLCPEIMTFRCKQDPEWTVTEMSASAEQVTGYPVEMFLDRQIIFCDLVHPDDVERVGQKLESAQPGETALDLRYRIRHANGGLRTLWERCLCSRDPVSGALSLDCAAIAGPIESADEDRP